MKARIHYIEREIQIVPAPEGCFSVGTDGIISYPFAIAIAPAVTKEERGKGDIITCPIIGEMFDDSGYDNLWAEEIFTSMHYVLLHHVIDGAMILWGVDFDKALSVLLRDFKIHKVKLDYEARRYLRRIMKEQRFISLAEYRKGGEK